MQPDGQAGPGSGFEYSESGFLKSGPNPARPEKCPGLLTDISPLLIRAAISSAYTTQIIAMVDPHRGGCGGGGEPGRDPSVGH